MIMKGDLTYSFYRTFFLLLKSILLLTLKKKFDLIFSKLLIIPIYIK